ncbi:MAG: ThuA domain-containing protein [Phycisphaerae bacterium]|nr:ThuA domain-containing protein [Phycisphaerae bacterium]
MQKHESWSLTRTAILIVLAAAAGPQVRAESSSTQPATAAKPLRVLLFAGGEAHDFDHLPRTLAEALSQSDDLAVRVSTDVAELTEASLRDCDVVAFETCLESGLSETQLELLTKALHEGKGVVAIHCALWCFQDRPQWRAMIGGLVLNHDRFGPFEAAVVDRGNPIAAGLPEKFTVTDEAYYVDQRRPDMRVILQTARTHANRPMPEPLAWTLRHAGGRVFTISLGHDAKVQADPHFLRLLANGIRWAGGRLGPTTVPSELERRQGFEPLFNGKTLAGWRYDPKLWKVKDGIIIGSSHPDGLEVNACAITEEAFGDFILRFDVKFISGNTGVQFRSEELPQFEVAGYQADVVPLGWGNLHEQNGRRRLVDGWTGKAEHAVNVKDWCEMEVEARGPRIIIRANGVVTADWTETDASRPRKGIIALQLHRGEPMEVQFTNIRIKRLNRP